MQLRHVIRDRRGTRPDMSGKSLRKPHGGNSGQKDSASRVGSSDSTPPYLDSSEADSKDEGDDTNGFKTVYLEGSDTPVVMRPHNRITRFLLASKLKPIPETRQPSPKSLKNPLSAMTWSWVSPLIHKGYNRILEINDIFLIPENERNERRMADYQKKLSQYKTADHRIAYAEFWAMLYAIRWPFILAFLSACMFVAGEMGMSLMSRSLLELVNDIYYGDTSKRGRAVAFAVGNTLVQLGFSFFFVWNGYRTRYLAEICRTMLISAIYDKLTKLSPAGRQMFPASKVTSVITTDTNRIYMAGRWTAIVLVFAPAFGGMLAILVHNIGVACLPGCGLVLLGIFINIFVSRFITGLRRKSLPFADARIATVRETLENMRIIKFYGWESSFVKLVARARSQEAGFLIKLGMTEGFVDATLTSIPQFAGALSFAVRIIIGKSLPAALAFPSLTLFQLFVPLSMMFSSGMTTHADAWASVKRIDEFFRAPEEASYVIGSNVENGAIIINNGHFKWDGDAPIPAQRTRWLRRLRFYKREANLEAEQNALPLTATIRPLNSAVDDYVEEREKNLESNEKSQPMNDDESETGAEGLTRAGAKKFPGLVDININIQPKELIMVVGPIGSGKTTLLSALVGIVSKQKGAVMVGGKVSTVMSTWSQNATIRSNILFGKEYDEQRYAETIHACSLESDFETFAGRDFSEVGERGITLSGGQKARLALARCVYAGGDVVLLDDVLSAVDSRVSNHIFKYCIRGLLKDSTRIMVTHNLKLLTSADRVVFMNGEGGAVVGSLEDILSTQPAFKRMYQEATNNSDDDDNDGALLEQQRLTDPNLKPMREALYYDSLQQRQAQAEDYDDVDAGDGTEFDAASVDEMSVKKQLSRAPKDVDTKLVKDEQRLKGAISNKVMMEYLSSGSRIGLALIPVVVVVQCAVASAQVMQSVFLQFWTSNRYHHPNGFYIGFYCLIVFMRALFFVAVVITLCVFCFNSSSHLHNQAVENIYRAPMSYFDSTPLGRIVNRFTDDTANLDTQLFMQLRLALFSLGMLLASIVTIFVYIPWAILALIPLVVIAFVLLNYYRASARELKRINSVFRGSMFTLVTETISGLSVILSFRRQQEFADDLNKRIDDMNVSFQINLASQYWLAFRMAIATLSVTFIVVMLAVYQVFKLDTSKVGTLMSLLPGVAITIVMFLPMLAELENQMNAVERLYELGHSLPQEAAFHIPETAPPASWPDRGAITLEHASLRYRPELPLVLNDVSAQIAGGEKVGICGRTGAGKSTILSALFRITELSAGKIVVDGIDISTIGLEDLRTKLAIIPQEPVLFQGTIRSNLDPFNAHSDAELWDALRRSGVIRREEFEHSGAAVRSHRFHLDTKIDSDGSNFSLGERQLLTLARALVRNAKIIVLDEATATVDFETDKLIQDTIAKEFEACTIMCIAHRLQTIIAYDRIIVMEKGEILEMGPPLKLFEDTSSRFHSMCRDSGITEKDFLGSQQLP